MKLKFFLFLCFFALVLPAAAQSSFTITGSQCIAPIAVDAQATVAFHVTGATWTGTIQPKISIAGQAPVNAQVAPANSSTKQGTVTANGAYIASVAGYSLFQLCGATVTNTATLYVNISPYAH